MLFPIKLLLHTNTSGTLNVQDSFLSFSGIDSWVVYSNANDRDANTNSIGSGHHQMYIDFLFLEVQRTIYVLL